MRILVAVFAIALAVNCLHWFQVATLDEFQLGSLLHDDGYYYLVIAENILDGKGVTFDGLHPTTGFQPLYQGLTIAIVWLSRAADVSVFRTIFFANLCLTGLAGVVLAGTVNRCCASDRPWPAYLLVGLVLPLNFVLVFKRLGAGLEMALALFLLSLLLRTACSRAIHHPNGWFRFREGLLLAALTLTRIDYALFAVAFGGFLVYVWRGKGLLRPLALYASGYALVVGAYAVFAYVSLDSVLPVSFLTKQYYAATYTASLPVASRISECLKNVLRIWMFPTGYLLYGYYWAWGGLGLAVATAVVALASGTLVAVGRTSLGTVIARPGLVWFAVAVVAHSILLAWSGVGFITSAYFWYYAPELVLLVVGVSVLWVEANRGRSALGWAAAAAIGGAFVGSTSLYRLDQEVASYAPVRKAIEITRTLTPPNAVIGSWDAGHSGYWLRPRRVINLDGMVNSRDYLETVIKTGNVAGYVAEQRIEFLSNMAAASDAARAAVSTHSFGHPSIVRGCYDILSETPFERQHIVLYLMKYHCR